MAREVAEWKHAGPLRARGRRRCGSVRPARTGSRPSFLDADIAMPAIYARALSPAEIAARFAARALARPTGLRAAGVLAARRGARRARAADASPHDRHATDHQSRRHG